MLEKYVDKFKNLDVNKDDELYLTGKAPHKPFLLLALIKLYEKDLIDLRNINPKTALRPNSDLRTLWKEFWRSLKYEKTRPIRYPFYSLEKDGFWNIELKDEFNSLTRPNVRQPSLGDIKNRVGRVYLDEELVELIDIEESRERLINTLYLEYFYTSERETLKEEMNK